MSELSFIFHVDDDEDILDMARMSLEMVGSFHVEQANLPLKALEKIQGLEPDLLLLDVMMPDMDGPQLFREIRKMPGYEHLPVVFMTAKAQAIQTDELQGDGVLGVVAKPFDPMELPEQVRQLWNEHTG